MPTVAIVMIQVDQHWTFRAGHAWDIGAAKVQGQLSGISGTAWVLANTYVCPLCPI